MSEANLQFQPGDLVRCRGREWIVLPGTDGDLVRLRPLSGAESDVQLVDRTLESEPVASAAFDPPDLGRPGPQDAALLLRDALLLSLRRGAGPFRSAGAIAFEPRAYQLVPLLMALKLDPVRLLIADDVGIGKTLEAGLIARELLDRGDLDALTVLCPPHLVEQWCGELAAKLQIQPVAVTAATAARLERALPQTESIFSAHPVTVVSLDYIKSDRRRNDFLRACPPLVIVDEAHACVGGGTRGRHQRHALLRQLADDPARHLVLLTATPHSGDDEAFRRLLGLLQAEFGAIDQQTGAARETLRRRLAAHFVQRRRVDIEQWSEPGVFPRRESAEATYRLEGEPLKFLDAVLDHCAGVTLSAGGDEPARRMAFWSTLALMRCVGSSPAAALRTLRTRTAGPDADVEELAGRLLDGDGDELTEDDTEPGADAGDPALGALIRQAGALARKPERDPKLMRLRQVIDDLVKADHAPVVFCRFIATAEAVGAALAKWFPDHAVGVVTGTLAADERKERVDALGEAERRILVATDCLSEGINLQAAFDAVVHYDLSWNPTRHQQREGRVDRFGQPKPVVRTVLIYGENNPVDGAVLEVILRKAERIRRETGVPVPLPDEGGRLTQALMQAVLVRRRDAGRGQLAFDFDAMPESQAFDLAWRDAADGEARTRTVFAQASIKPAEVLPEWEATRQALGGPAEARRFLTRSLARLGAPAEETPRGLRVPLTALPAIVRERLAIEGFEGSLRFGSGETPPPGHVALHRSHPVIGVLSETLLEAALDGAADPDDPATLARCGAWSSTAVTSQTLVALLRLRHRVETARRTRRSLLLAEEATAIAWSGEASMRVATDAQALTLIEAQAGPLTAPARARLLDGARRRLEVARADLDAFAAERAAALAEDHARVRRAAETAAARVGGVVTVSPVLPVDVIGLYLLVPALA